MLKRLGVCLILFSSLALGQGSRYESHPAIKQRPDGALIPTSATIAVCTQPANTATTPCSPLATLYTDATLSTACSGTLKDGSTAGATNCSNPLTTDSKGNYHFYGGVGPYTLQVYGSGLQTSVEPDIMIAGMVSPLATLSNINGVTQITSAGTDLGTQINNAITAFGASGGSIRVAASAASATWAVAVSITKPVRLTFDVATYAYTGTTQAIVCTSVNAPIIEGSGFQGGGSANGTIFTVSDTSTNGLDINVCPGAILRDFTISGPGSGTGKGIIYTGNSGLIQNVVEKSFGGNGCTIDGTRGSSNAGRMSGVRCVSNGGIGLNVFGTNGNLWAFQNVESSSNTGLGFQCATAANFFQPLHMFSNNAGGNGATFLSGCSANIGEIYSDSGTQTTDLTLNSGANSNDGIFLPSGQTVSDSGTNNSIYTSRFLGATAGASTPTYSWSAQSSTGFYNSGGNSIGVSNNGATQFTFGTTKQLAGSGQIYAWSSNADPTLAGSDTGFSRVGAGVIGAGNGFAANTSAELRAATFTAGTSIKGTSLIFSTTAPSIAAAGCGGSAASIPNNNGTAAFEVNVGSTPGSACTITMPAAAHGWACSAVDVTTNSTSIFYQKQSPAASQTTTQIVITNFNDVAAATAFTASDVVRVLCNGY